MIVPIMFSALALLLSASKPILPPTIPLAIEHGTMFVPPYRQGIIPAYPWRVLAECESGNVWNIDTHNGFYGGLQITASLWLRFRPDGALEQTPSGAQPLVQVMAARNIIRYGGFGGLRQVWGGCARLLNLP